MSNSASDVSPAEWAIVELVCAGKRNEEIAAALGKSLGTVKNQLSSAYRKLKVSSRTQLIVVVGKLRETKRSPRRVARR